MTNPNNPELESFVAVDPQSHFPIQNLPYGIFKKKGSKEAPRVGVAIGDLVLDLSVLEKKKLLTLKKTVFNKPVLNPFMDLGSEQWDTARLQISELLRHDNPKLKDNQTLRDSCFVPQEDVDLLLPVDIRDYTDFYSSKEHASNVGAMFRDRANPLLPNWKHLPVGYHGRASSIVVSGTEIKRPFGQFKKHVESPPELDRTAKLDFELELAFFMGKSNSMSTSVSVDEASSYVFGAVLMNDWSARDIQKWEYVPLGPFVSKSFATSVSAWVVPYAALQPFKAKGPEQVPQPLPYLCGDMKNTWQYDIHMQVDLKPEGTNKADTISQTNAKWLYWSIEQQIAHHTITGCNLHVGDLLASGTISGQDEKSYGSLLELSWNGSKPVSLSNRSKRSFLEDHDEVTMTAWCQADKYRIGFGEVVGKIIP